MSSTPRPPTPWRIAEVAPERVAALTTSLRCSPQLAALLLNRGVEDADCARRFLRPEWSDLHDPFSMRDMDRAVARIRKALGERQRILVFGDFDVDGLTSTALLSSLFSLMGHPVTTVVPDRLTDGYGLSLAAATGVLTAHRPDLVLTVDCGVSDRAGIGYLREHGVDVVVTDHHVTPDQLPPACAVVNPMRPDCSYATPRLAGVGVAFKLASALASSFSPRRRMTEEFSDFLLQATALVALGTVCDVVPLIGENRVLVSHGLRSLAASANPGLRALLDVAGISGRSLEPYHLGFKLGPRINAAGRMGCPEVALKLFAATSYQEAVEHAAHLDRLNTRRQGQERAVLTQVNQMLPDLPRPPAEGVVLARDGWSPGITGIVASRLVDAHHAPAVLIALQGDHGRGSGRSIAGFNLLEILSEFGDQLESFGGHARALGFTVARDKLEGFTQAFGRRLAEALAAFTPGPRFSADCVVDLDQVTPKLLREVEQLKPHGEGNPAPVFVSRQLRVPGHPKVAGRAGRSIRFLVNQDAERPPVAASSRSLGMNPRELKALAPIDMAYVPRCVFQGGQGVLELTVKAVAPSAPVAENQQQDR